MAIRDHDDERRFCEARRRMVDEQLRRPGRGISDERVLAAMGRVPRHRFVSAALAAEAYADCPLPIGGGQTISQPYIVALMTEWLQVGPHHRVLEIGTGCGYHAAVLAELAAEVFSVEWRADLSRAARARLGEDRIRFRVGDGWAGWPAHAPYDRILVTCAPDEVPDALLRQLADPGRMVLPVGLPHEVQRLCAVDKRDGVVTFRERDAVRFVPMVHGVGA